MAEPAPLAGKNGRHPPSLHRQSGMPDRVNASVDPVQPTRLHPSAYGIVAHTRLA